jgi:hypothetical protein
VKFELSDEFLEALAAVNGIHVGRCGRRVGLRRWLHMLATPIRFPQQGGISWRLFLFVSCLMGGYGALLWEELSPNVTAVLHTDRHAGLDLRMVSDGDESSWKITSFWAWPTGRGHGRDVLAAVLTAADATGATLVLNAANRWLAAEYYAPLGFVVRPGQEGSRRPWIERRPASACPESAVDRRRSGLTGVQLRDGARRHADV